MPPPSERPLKHLVLREEELKARRKLARWSWRRTLRLGLRTLWRLRSKLR